MSYQLHVRDTCAVVTGDVAPSHEKRLVWGAELMLERCPLFILREPEVLAAAGRHYEHAAFVLAVSVAEALVDLTAHYNNDNED